MLFFLRNIFSFHTDSLSFKQSVSKINHMHGEFLSWFRGKINSGGLAAAVATVAGSLFKKSLEAHR